MYIEWLCRLRMIHVIFRCKRCAKQFVGYNIFANNYSDLSLSPIGEIFRSRLRQFPSLVTCCTIDWFSEWPDEALKSVATNFLQDITEIDNPDTIPGLVSNNTNFMLSTHYGHITRIILFSCTYYCVRVPCWSCDTMQ